MSGSSRPVVVIHGGAWAIPAPLTEASKAGVVEAARRGHAVLRAGGSAVDAVETAVKVLEDDPAFDAGKGSVLNALGQVEMDSVVMDGKDLRLGAIACVQDIQNPVSLARMVMEQTDHTLLVGQGANAYAEEMGVPRVSPESLVTQEAREEYETYLKFRTAVQVSFRPQGTVPVQAHDTVGAVALDLQGNLACATSTGGITAKRPGRVGDSPLVGSGAYADNASAAVSTTGHGESISKVCLAHTCVQNVKLGSSAQKAAEEALSYMTERVQGCGGLIALTPSGDIGIHFTTERMAWAYADGQEDQIHYGIDPNDDFVEDM